MTADSIQGGIFILLAVIGIVAVLSLVTIASAFRAIRLQQDTTNRILTSKDLGPALHGLVQQSKEMNRLLAIIDKRLEKLEALEKVQIANMTYRDDMNRRGQRS
jgi:hypothetical protein